MFTLVDPSARGAMEWTPKVFDLLSVSQTMITLVLMRSANGHRPQFTPPFSENL
jgi:hypothetical protein